MAADNIVLDFSSTGQVEGMHFDEFDLGFLGSKKVTRASEILHDDERDDWYIVLPGESKPATNDVTGFRTYNGARAFEVEWLQASRKARVQPQSLEGIQIAREIRLSYIE